MAYRFFPILTLAEDVPYFPPDPDEPQTRRLAWRGVWLALFAIVPFISALRAPSIWLDEPMIFRNVLLRTASGLGQIWFHPRSLGDYHPAAATAAWIEYHLFGGHPFGYHAVSLALHVASALLLWHVLRRLNVPGAWLAAAVFAAHPLALQPVAWISRQEHMLGTAAFLGSLLAALRFFEIEPPEPDYYLDRYPEPRRAAYATSIVLFAISALCLPAMAVEPVVLALVLWWKRGRVTREQWMQSAPKLVLAASLVALQTWLWSTGETVSDVKLSLAQRLALAPMAVCFYAFKTVVPYPVLFTYPRWKIIPWQGAGCAAAIVIAVGGLAWWAHNKQSQARGCLVAAVFFLASLIPALAGWRGEGTTYAWVADFLAYPAMIGLIVPLVAALTYAISRLPRHALQIRLATGALLIAALIALTLVQASPLGSEIELWKATLARGGPSAIAYERLGVALLERGDASRDDAHHAMEALRKGQALDPSDPRAATYLGLAYESLGQWGDAVAEYRRALQANPSSADVYVRLAAAYTRLGNLAEAESMYRAALNLRPRDPAIHNSLGLILALGGRWGEAIDQYNEALDANPDLISARLNLADAEYRRGNFDAAASQLQEIIKKDPQHPNYEALMNAGFILHQHREYAKAEQMFRTAVDVNPRSPEARNALGMVQAAQGRLNEAILNFEQALDLKHDYEEARRNLEAARRQKGI